MRFKYEKFFEDEVKRVDFNELCYLVTLTEEYARRYYTHVERGSFIPPNECMRVILEEEFMTGRITRKNAMHYVRLSAWFGLQGGLENVTALSTLSCVLEDMLK